MNRRKLLTAIGASAVSPRIPAQTFGSFHDPQLASFSLEGKVPLTHVLSDLNNVLGLPPEALPLLQSGAYELRGRADFNRGARIFRLYNMVVPATIPYPLPEPPAIDNPSVGNVFDLSLEHIYWYDWGASDPAAPARRAATIIGRRLGIYKGTTPLPEQPVVMQIAMLRDNPSAFRMFTLSVAGVLCIVAPNPVGHIEFDPPRLSR